MLRPSRPMMRPFSSSERSSTTETVVSIAWPPATRCMTVERMLRARRSASCLVSSSTWRITRADSWRSSSSSSRMSSCLACPALSPARRSSSRTCWPRASLSLAASWSRFRWRSSRDCSRASWADSRARRRSSRRPSSARRACSSSSTAAGSPAGCAAVPPPEGGGCRARAPAVAVAGRASGRATAPGSGRHRPAHATHREHDPRGHCRGHHSRQGDLHPNPPQSGARAVAARRRASGSAPWDFGSWLEVWRHARRRARRSAVRRSTPFGPAAEVFDRGVQVEKAAICT